MGNASYIDIRTTQSNKKTTNLMIKSLSHNLIMCHINNRMHELPYFRFYHFKKKHVEILLFINKCKRAHALYTKNNHSESIRSNRIK